MACFRSIPAAFLSIAVLLPCQADDLGRLFTTPAQRSRLDAARGGENTARAGASKGGADSVVRPRQLKLSGTLISSTGARQVWLNGKAVSGSSPDGTRLRLLDRERVLVRAPGTGTRRVLRPGQVLDIDRDQVSEAYLVQAPGAAPTAGAHGKRDEARP